MFQTHHIQKLTLTWALLGALLTLGACGDDGEEEIDEPAPEGITLATFNVGLARGFVPYAADRVAPVGESINAYSGDVICLQEVWFQEEIDAVLAATSGQWPHSYYLKTESDETLPGCTAAESDPLEACIQANCGDVPQDELASCGLSQCGDEFGAASPDCQGCIAANLNLPIEEIVATCSGGGPALAYGGHNGLLLLSKHPMSNTDHMAMTSTITQRSVLRADIEVPDQGPVSVYCTHLAADLSASLPYRENDDYSSYQEEQAAQIESTLDWVGSKTNHDNTLILGDFNTGPAVGDNAAELSENFGLFAASGWVSPFATSADPLCTFCADNRVQGGGADSKLEDGSTGVLIDHAFVPSAISARITSSGRVFDQLQPITVTNNDGTQEEIDLHLSDHYGVQVLLKP